MRLSLLQKRGDIYHFRWTVPHDLRPVLKRREFTKSLKTSSKLTALSEAGELYSIVEKIRNIRRLYQLGKLSKESLEQQVQQIWDQVGHGLLNPPSGKPLAQAQEDNDNLYRSLRTLSINPDASVTDQGLTKLLEPEGVVRARFTEGAKKRRYKRVLGDALEGSGLEFDDEDLSTLVQQLIQAQAYYAQRMNDFLDEDKPIQPPVFVTAIADDESQVELAKHSTPLFSAFYERWLKRKIQKGIANSLVAEYGRFYCDWEDLMDDKPICQYRRGDIREFILDCSMAPKRNLKPYKGIPLSELLELDIPVEHRVANKTADQVRKWIQGVFSLAVTEELIEASPATGLKLNFDKSKSYDNFEDSHVSMMLEAVLNEESWKKWLVWIAAYTGMRRSEIVQLRKSDVRLDPDSGRHYIIITDEGEGQSVKTEAGKRKIPLHKQLELIGFLGFVDGCKDKLFPDLQPRSVTGWFNGRFRAGLGIPDTGESGQRLVFHSFRHCVVTKALAHNVTAIVQEVIGHEQQKMGTTSVYNHRKPLSELLSVIDCIKYH